MRDEDTKLISQSIGEAQSAGHVATMRLLCEQLLELEPELGPTWVQYADCLTDLSLYAEAEHALSRAKELVTPRLQHLLCAQQGHLFKKKGEYAEAEGAYLEAHELDPDDATYLIYAGCAACARGDILRAEHYARRAVACKEGCLDEAWANLGGYLLIQKRYEEAKECYENALAIDPDFVPVRDRLADIEKVSAIENT